MANLAWLRIPAEMRGLRQWAVSTLKPTGDGKVDKAPRHPVTHILADSTNPATWGTFEEAMNSGMPAIGFMLATSDPFVVIDLDVKDATNAPNDPQRWTTPEQVERHRKIYGALDSYSELSQSGRGCHIILRGHIGGGMNRDAVEIYDQERYIICTGNITRDSPVRAHDELLARLVEEMGGVRQEHDLPESAAERYTDAEILDKASHAKNGEKFKELYFKAPGPNDDWSQRDASLAQIIAFYTRNHEQALRLFRGSALYRPNAKGKSPQHYEEYYLLGRTFARAWRAEQARDANVEHGRQLAAAAMTKPASSVTKVPDFPPGLIGKVADYIYRAAPRPVKEIALAGALAFAAGLMGRQYNVGGTGLNLYVVLLAETGRGKESAPSGIEALVKAVRSNMPAVDIFIGPGALGSGQALIRALDKNPAQVSMLSEFGHMLRAITDKRASALDVKMRQVLLSLFSKSGKGQMLRGTAYSDTDKNTKDIESPAFSFLGDTTPEAYYSCFTSGMVGEGLLPRFLSITYDGPRVPPNETPWSAPSAELVEHLGSVVAAVIQMQHNNTWVDVGFSVEAKNLDRQFDQYCDDRINEPGVGAMAEVWNRAHLKMRRVAALLAVGRNHLAPLISVEDVEWAIQVVRADIETLESTVSTGDVGEGEARKAPAVVKAIKDYLQMPVDKREKTYKVPKALLGEPLIPYGYFRRRFKQHSSFLQDPRGLAFAIKAALQDAVDMGLLQKLSDEQKALKVGARCEGDVYCLGENFE